MDASPANATGRWVWPAAWFGGPALVVLLLSAPVLQGAVPFPTDILRWIPPWSGALRAPAQPPDFTRLDSLIQYAAASVPYAAGLRAGRIDLWDPYMFLGYPQYAGTASLIAPFFPTTLLFGRVFPPTVAVTLQPLFLLWLMGVAMAGFLRHRGLHPVAALVGAAAWQSAAGVHAWFAMPVFMIGLWGIPALCWGADRLVARPGPGMAAGVSVLLALLLLGQSPNPLVFAVSVATAWGIVGLVAARPTARHVRRVVAWTAVAAGLGLALGALGWMPMLEFLGHTYRTARMPWDTLYASRMPAYGVLAFALPEYFGGTWSARSLLTTSLPEIVHGVGAVGLVAAVCAVGHDARRLTRFAAALIAFGMLVALGTPLARVVAFVPGFGTSVLPRLLQLVEWALAVLVAVGVDHLLRRTDQRIRVRALVAAVGMTVAIVIGLTLGPALVARLPGDATRAMTPDFVRAHFALTAPWWRPTWAGLVLLMGSAAAGLATRRRTIVVVGFAAALLLERGWYVTHMTPWQPAASLFPPVAATRHLADAVPPTRIINPAGFPNAVKPLGVASPDGYNPFIFRTYLRLLELGFPEKDFRTYHLLKVPPVDSPVMHLLGVQGMLLSPGMRPGAPFREPAPAAGVARNPRAWPRAVIIPEAVAAPTDDAATALMASDTARWRERAVVTGKLSAGPRGGRGDARVAYYAAESVRITTDTDGPSWLLLSDQHYPGWTATVDDAPVEILRAFLALRLVPVPAGHHTVTFAFRPPVLRRALVCSVVGALAVGLLIAYAARRRVRA